jgi:hypothetical protein
LPDKPQDLVSDVKLPKRKPDPLKTSPGTTTTTMPTTSEEVAIASKKLVQL